MCTCWSFSLYENTPTINSDNLEFIVQIETLVAMSTFFVTRTNFSTCLLNVLPLKQTTLRTKCHHYVSFHHTWIFKSHKTFKNIHYCLWSHISNTLLCVIGKLKDRPYPLIGLIDDIICESLRHLAGSIFGSLQRMIQVTLWCGGYHCWNKRSDGSRCLSEERRIQFLE